MKQEWMQNTQNGLCILLNHLLFIAGAITVSELFLSKKSMIWLWALFVIVPLGFYFFTKKVPKLILPPMFIILLGIMSFIEKAVIINDWSIYYYVITFVYLVGYFIYYFTKNFLDFLRLNQHTASNIPIQDIFQNGIGLTVLFSACSSVVLLVSSNVDWVKIIADKIWSGILVILSYIFSGIHTNPPLEGKEELTQKDPQLGSSNMSQYIPEQTLDGIRNLMIILLCVAIVIGLILFLYYVYYVIKGMEGSEKRKKKVVRFAENEDVREYCGIEKKSQEKAGISFFRSNREKIRRLYQKKVLKRKKELIGDQDQQRLKYLTAKECCDKLSEQQLKLVYEKARYSPQEISAEDVRLAK